MRLLAHFFDRIVQNGELQVAMAVERARDAVPINRDSCSMPNGA